MTPRPVTAWYVTGLLGLLYIVSYADRLVLTLLIEPLKVAFGVSDTAMSLLIGLSFAAFYAVIGLPLARLADRGSRRNLVVAGVLLWSSCTVASAWAGSFAMLAVLRIGVALGEAVLTPCAVSLISDLFPPGRRAAATSLYVFCGTLGAFGAFLLGGLAVAAADSQSLAVPLLSGMEAWRVVFLLIGLPGIVLGAMFRLTVREPPRSGESRQGEPLSSAQLRNYLQRDGGLLACLFVGSSLGQLLLLGLSTWTPSFLVRRFGWQVADAGMALGVLGIVASALGLALIPRFANTWTQRGRSDALPIVASATVGVPCVLIVAATFMNDGWIFLILASLAFVPLVCSGTLAMIGIQWIGPPRAQALLTAVLFLVNSLLAFGLGPLLVSAIAQYRWFGAADLGAAFAWVAVLTAPLGAALLWLARGSFGAALQRARAGH